MLTASCLCGGIQLELHGNLRPVVNCHCSQCLKTHGNFAAYTNLPRSAVHYVKQDTLRWYRSSDTAQRGFCHGCGASVFWSRDDDDAISVAAGVLDAPTGLATAADIFVASKGDYYDINSGVPAYAASGNSSLDGPDR